MITLIIMEMWYKSEMIKREGVKGQVKIVRLQAALYIIQRSNQPI
jgi:competence protein ComGC